jgi:phosphatidate phosphatase LPIN
MPGSFEEEPGSHFPSDVFGRSREEGDDIEAQRRGQSEGADTGSEHGDDEGEGDLGEDYDDDDTIFDDDILAAGEMRNVPF